MMKEKEKKRICYFINNMNQLLRVREKRRDLHITNSLFQKNIHLYTFEGLVTCVALYSFRLLEVFNRKERIDLHNQRKKRDADDDSLPGCILHSLSMNAVDSILTIQKNFSFLFFLSLLSFL